MKPMRPPAVSSIVITMMKPPAAELAELLARVAARDREAFAAVYKATSAKLWGIVVRILPRRAMAEDVLQDVYVRIWERAASKSEAPLRATLAADCS